MVTSLGHDAATSCAAIRAGLSRARAVPGCAVLDPDTQTMEPAIGHEVWGLTRGMSAPARWITLATRAFVDLCQRGIAAVVPRPEDWHRTALLLVGPCLDDGRFLFFPECSQGHIDETLVQPLRRRLAVPLEVDRCLSIFEGRTGAMRAVDAATRMLQDPAIDRVILLAFDSLLDAHSLAWLQDSERLKAAEVPSGLMPGEAAAALMLTRGGTGHRLVAAGLAQEAADPLSDGRQHGRALSQVLRAALSAGAPGRRFKGDLFVDLNGEAWRAYEYGSALAQVDGATLGDFNTMLPALSIGEVGAASSLCAAVLACAAFDRGYASDAMAIVLAAGEAGRVGSLVLMAEV
ncbi:MAG: hypothetical protein U5L05_14520 [Rubrivivax sp.]|nr:hypothetical protein [Rubrivivax sp.]